ncbi:sigma-70 family RNA polymerase sigma factor [Komarekiella sp. 'clone 1']|uniref:Sigma-70 family RNA polymerase sigma factor n=1 Tax=Komarekiella delphini-convector SJRDD-AB1 TaxID=2593771 RepID=A0AA40SVB0_9NOST|nr:sigma-70 family RNA polymerase sigma factor [Komarekiella delphini-convector]MBD6615714.1 sigma-70 family RNA polymerase sigma factor [Komarekiella delphini-convector SJRDD-AB1]
MNYPSSCPLQTQFLPEFRMKSDEELAQEAQHCSEAFAELYRRNLKAVYSYHLAKVGNIHDAQDLTAQTFLVAQEAISSFRGRGKFAAWLLGIARRKTADYFRRKRPTLPLEEASQVADGTISPDELVTRQLSLEQIAQALSLLTPERAEAVALQIFAGLSAAEVGQVMGKSEAAVKMLICRALKDLRKYLETTYE